MARSEVSVGPRGIEHSNKQVSSCSVKLCPGWSSVQAALEAVRDGPCHVHKSQGHPPGGLDNELHPEKGVEMGSVGRGRRSSPGRRTRVKAWAGLGGRRKPMATAASSVVLVDGRLRAAAWAHSHLPVPFLSL